MAGTATVVLNDAVDTWVDNRSVPLSTKNYATAVRLWVDSGEAESLVYFGFPAPVGASIISAKLRLYTYGSWRPPPRPSPSSG